MSVNIDADQSRLSNCASACAADPGRHRVSSVVGVTSSTLVPRMRSASAATPLTGSAAKAPTVAPSAAGSVTSIGEPGGTPIAVAYDAHVASIDRSRTSRLGSRRGGAPASSAVAETLRGRGRAAMAAISLNEAMATAGSRPHTSATTAHKRRSGQSATQSRSSGCGVRSRLRSRSDGTQLAIQCRGDSRRPGRGRRRRMRNSSASEPGAQSATREATPGKSVRGESAQMSASKSHSGPYSRRALASDRIDAALRRHGSAIGRRLMGPPTLRQSARRLRARTMSRLRRRNP